MTDPGPGGGLPRPGKVVLLVCDSLGVGEAPDAGDYGDEGADTAGHAAAAVGGLALPTLESWGFGRLTRIAGVEPVDPAAAVVGRMAERSAGKDTTTGHWEMMGVVLDQPFPTYPDGFPPEVIDAFADAIGRGVLGNKPASGTEIIEELGAEHLETGKPIVYTSADSVFQIATHKRVVPLDQLYAWCEQARALLEGRARRRPGDRPPLRRRPRRRSPAPRSGATSPSRPPARPCSRPLRPPAFAPSGSARSRTSSPAAAWSPPTTPATTRPRSTHASASSGRPARRPSCSPTWSTSTWSTATAATPRATPAAWSVSTPASPRSRPRCGADDWLFITADHGCDPTAPGTDHTREFTPLVAYSPGGTSGQHLPDRTTFADLGTTIADLFAVPPVGPGTSFASDLR